MHDWQHHLIVTWILRVHFDFHHLTPHWYSFSFLHLWCLHLTFCAPDKSPWSMHSDYSHAFCSMSGQSMAVYCQMDQICPQAGLNCLSLAPCLLLFLKLFSKRDPNSRHPCYPRSRSQTQRWSNGSSLWCCLVTPLSWVFSSACLRLSTKSCTPWSSPSTALSWTS